MAVLEESPISGQITIDEAIAEAEKDAPVVISSVTPSGIEVQYSPAPKRFYRVRKAHASKGEHDTGFYTEWQEVPSVTSVLGVLEKGGLSWWGMKVGIEGVQHLLRHGIVHPMTSWSQAPVDDVVDALTREKLTVNHTLSKAGDRGTSVHDALEDFTKTGQMPYPEIYPESEQGYVAGLKKFLLAWAGDNVCSDIQAEVMVGSLVHLYAGRYDLRCYFGGGNMVTRTYPKRANKIEELPAGRYMLDLKTSSGVYPSHALQLAAYEGASVECGYEPTDYRAVIHVTKAGEYELVLTSATLEDFLSVRATYDVMQRKMIA